MLLTQHLGVDRVMNYGTLGSLKYDNIQVVTVTRLKPNVPFSQKAKHKAFTPYRLQFYSSNAGDSGLLMP